MGHLAEHGGPTGEGTRMECMRRFLILGISLMSSTTAFSIFAFSVYLNDLKLYFNLTQSEAELVMALNLLGVAATWPGGVLVTRFGLRFGALAALLCSAPFYFGIFGVFRTSNYDDNVYGILVFLFLMAGFGTGLTFIVSLTAAMRVFSARWRGTIVSFVVSGSSIGPLLFMTIYQFVFASTGEYRYDSGIVNYFALVAACFTVVNILGMIFYGEHTHNTEEGDTTSNHIPPDKKQLADDAEASSSSPLIDCSRKCEISPKQKLLKSGYTDATEVMSVCELFKTPMFHYIGWASVINLGLATMNLCNLVTYVISAGDLSYVTIVPYIAASFGVCGKLLIGFVSDRIIMYIPRIYILLTASIANMIMYAISIYLIDHIGVIIFNCIVDSLGCVIYFGLAPTILSEDLGVATFPKAWGIVALGNTLAGLLMTTLMGVFYDLYADPVTSVCLGYQCFAWSFSIATVMCAISVGLCLLYIRSTYF